MKMGLHFPSFKLVKIKVLMIPAAGGGLGKKVFVTGWEENRLAPYVWRTL